MEIIVIQKAFIIACMVIAIWCMMLPNMIFGKVRDIQMPDWLTSPIYECPVCQTFWYGSFFYWVFFRYNAIEWFLVIMVAMGIATIFVKIKKN